MEIVEHVRPVRCLLVSANTSTWLSVSVLFQPVHGVPESCSVAFQRTFCKSSRWFLWPFSNTETSSLSGRYFYTKLMKRYSTRHRISSLFLLSARKIEASRKERAFMLLLTAVRDITQALDTFCVLLNQLIGPLVFWKIKQLVIFF